MKNVFSVLSGLLLALDGTATPLFCLICTTFQSRNEKGNL